LGADEQDQQISLEPVLWVVRVVVEVQLRALEVHLLLTKDLPEASRAISCPQIQLQQAAAVARALSEAMARALSEAMDHFPAM
jgi:hypothetical protein